MIEWVNLDETDSTNEHAKRHDYPHHTVVTANRQTAGKGRDGRRFVSDEGGLYMSMVCKDAMPIDECAKYFLAAPLAVCRVLRVYGVNALIKWPNDVWVEGRKIAGILIETTWREQSVARAIIGIGVNVHNDVEKVPCAATSMDREGVHVDRMDIAGRIAAELVRLLAEKREELVSQCKAYLLNIGKAVVFADGKEGIALDLAADGRLVVRSGDEICYVAAGDVSLKE